MPERKWIKAITLNRCQWWRLQETVRTVASEFVPELLEGIFTFYGLLVQRFTAAGRMNDNKGEGNIRFPLTCSQFFLLNFLLLFSALTLTSLSGVPQTSVKCETVRGVCPGRSCFSRKNWSYLTLVTFLHALCRWSYWTTYGQQKPSTINMDEFSEISTGRGVGGDF